MIKPPPGEEATPFTHFLKLESPVFKTAAPDLAIEFKPEPLNSATDKTDWVGAISLSGQGAPVIATATAREVKLASGDTSVSWWRVKHGADDTRYPARRF